MTTHSAHQTSSIKQNGICTISTFSFTNHLSYKKHQFLFVCKQQSHCGDWPGHSQLAAHHLPLTLIMMMFIRAVHLPICMHHTNNWMLAFIHFKIKDKKSKAIWSEQRFRHRCLHTHSLNGVHGTIIIIIILCCYCCVAVKLKLKHSQALRQAVHPHHKQT